jgi:hypothetical protein
MSRIITKLHCWTRRAAAAVVPCPGLPSTSASVEWNNSTCSNAIGGTVCTGSCSGGTVGDLQSTCLESGRWSPVVGSCTFTPTCGDTNPDPATVTGFACGAGFVFNPAAGANTTLSDSSCCLQVRRACAAASDFFKHVHVHMVMHSLKLSCSELQAAATATTSNSMCYLYYLQVTCSDSDPVSRPNTRFTCKPGTVFNVSAAGQPAGPGTCCQVRTGESASYACCNIDWS